VRFVVGLDESTSQIDAATEAKLLRTLVAERHVQLLSITHRSRVLQFHDHALIMAAPDAGKQPITHAIGSHELELLTSTGGAFMLE
jgi:ABC-type uncharacterized transport system fused permease/ATPase subunit